MRNHATIDPLQTLATLTIRDVMNIAVVTVDAGWEMARAAQFFAARGISCAPVVDLSGQCVGILTATDFVRREVVQSQCGDLPRAPERTELAGDRDHPWNIACDLPDVVEHYMSRGVQSVLADWPVLTAARLLCDGHLHRLVVLDGRGAPVGMISTLDVIAALLNSLDEANLRRSMAHSHA